MMKSISVRSDLEIEVIFRDISTGQEIPVPIYDFELSYYVYSDKVQTATQINEVLSHNCKIIDGRLHIYLDAPDFGCGPLRTRHKYRIPNSNFPDKFRTIVREGILDVMIVGKACSLTSYPVIKTDVIAEKFAIIEILSAEEGSTLLSEEGYEILINKNNGRRNH